MENWDFYFRLLSIGAATLLIAQIAGESIRKAIKAPLLLMLVGAAAYLINTAPLIRPAEPLDRFVDLLSLSVPFWLWLFARNLFEREAPLRVALIAAVVIVAAWSLSIAFAPAGLIGFYIIHLVSLGLIVDLVRVALLDREDDLIEERRMIRLWLPLLVAAQAGTILTAELIYAPGAPPTPMRLFNALMIFALILFAGLSMLRTNPDLLIEQDNTDEPKSPPKLNLTPSEAVLHERLIAAMENKVYRKAGLTIAALAAELDTPEHRLRALINRRLGYRNFSAFLNRHRIAEARAKLVEKESVDLPVLTIAMDLGYNSLATFNRAFRAETGTTPSDYRRLGLSEAVGQN
ncbi:MAG: helix-turn-helix domain-containing protein [Pseudomonadota bacterium]